MKILAFNNYNVFVGRFKVTFGNNDATFTANQKNSELLNKDV